MRQGLLAAGALLLLAASASADGGVAPVSDEALWFRMEVGETPARTILGFVDEGKGTGEGYDLAVLDLDGDGKPESRQEIVRRENPRTGRPLPNTEIAIQHAGARWVLDLYSVGLRRSVPPERLATLPNYIRWSVTQGEFYAWFINGQAELYGSAQEAAAGKAIRLGGPFHFEVSAATRGPDALVNVALKDENGCTLRLARQKGVETKPLVRVSAKDEEKLATHADYG